jgi:MoxR-like ATPase
MATQKKQYLFTGNSKKRKAKGHADSPQQPEPYIVEAKLKQAVNLAIHLRRPLLLEGEAGCGKTRLAATVAYELGLPLYRWNVRSTSRAEDGFYKFDFVLRLHDVESQKVGTPLPRNPSDAKDYRRFGALGKAFDLKDSPAVVLIDEIDKADLDFPNDLLTVLDEPWAFEIPETEETICATHQPIVIITSNKEKGNLPHPFLRRCIYHYVSFPDDQDRLKEIVDAHYQFAGVEKPSDALVDVATQKFLDIRREGGLFKNPGTSEFLDWLNALWSFGQKKYSAVDLKKAQAIPFPDLLFKLKVDWEKYATSEV